MQQRTGGSCSICRGGSGAQEAAAVPQKGFSHISSWNLSHHEQNKAKPSPYCHPRLGGQTDRLFVQNNSRMQHNLEDIMKCFRNGLRQITTVSRAKYSSGCTYFQLSEHEEMQLSPLGRWPRTQHFLNIPLAVWWGKGRVHLPLLP